MFRRRQSRSRSARGPSAAAASGSPARWCARCGAARAAASPSRAARPGWRHGYAGGIELELHALGFFVARQRVEQPHHASLDQVVELDAGRQLHHHLVGDAAHQRRVRGHLVGLGLATGSGIHVHACLWRVLHDAPSINHLGRARGGVGVGIDVVCAGACAGSCADMATPDAGGASEPGWASTLAQLSISSASWRKAMAEGDAGNALTTGLPSDSASSICRSSGCSRRNRCGYSGTGRRCSTGCRTRARRNRPNARR